MKNQLVKKLNRDFTLSTFTVLFSSICLILVTAEITEFNSEVQDFSYSQSVMGALQHNGSRITLCSGSFYSNYYVFTSCRCLYSYTVTYPFYKTRNASNYIISLGGVNGTDLEISTFVMHPYCMSVIDAKPFRNHFGLVVVAKELVVPQAIAPLQSAADIEFTRHQLIQFSNQSLNCDILGHHSASGDVMIGTTKMVLMNAEKCLFRICIPKIGCKSKGDQISNHQDFCLKVVNDVKLEAISMEGSLVLCEKHVFGVVISPGSSRYPKVPTIFAAVSQFLSNFVINVPVA